MVRATACLCYLGKLPLALTHVLVRSTLLYVRLLGAFRTQQENAIAAYWDASAGVPYRVCRELNARLVAVLILPGKASLDVGLVVALRLIGPHPC